MSLREVICRLCLKMPQNEFVLMDETANQGLDALTMKMNLDVSSGPLMCEDCVENFKRSLSFISVCLNSEKSILLFNTGGEKINIDLRDVYTYNSNEIVYGDTLICRFCIKQVEGTDLIPLNDIKKENTYLDIFKEYMFKMDQNVVKNQLICFQCRDDIESYIKFLLRCFDTEQKIEMHRQNEGITSGEKIMLHNVFQQFSKYTLEYPEEDMQVFEQVYVKKEEGSMEYVAEIESIAFKLESDELHIKDTSSESIYLQNNTHMFEVCQCNKTRKICSKCRSQFDIVSTEPNIYKCKLCPYQGVRMKSHMSKHRDIPAENMIKCTVCGYMTNEKTRMKYHSLIHKAKTEVTMYKCTACDFKTKHKNSLKNHSVTHKTEAELTMYKCTACDYSTVHRRNLQNHSLLHKTEAELMMYKCTTCDFKTIYKCSLKKHVLTHKTEAEVMHKCMVCDFKTFHKCTLKTHLLTHEAKLKIYECAACDFLTLHKRSLQNHSVLHKTEAELTMFKCTACHFKTIYKNSLKKHVLTHKAEAEVMQCTACDFKTLHKYELKRHMLTHVAEAELTMYKCAAYDFQKEHQHHL